MLFLSEYDVIMSLNNFEIEDTCRLRQWINIEKTMD